VSVVNSTTEIALSRKATFQDDAPGAENPRFASLQVASLFYGAFPMPAGGPSGVANKHPDDLPAPIREMANNSIERPIDIRSNEQLLFLAHRDCANWPMNL
jgi:hypothetical protein